MPRKGKYWLRVVPKRGPNDRRYEPMVVEIDGNESYKTMVVPSRTRKGGDVVGNRHALVGPLLFALAVLAFLYKD